LFLAAYFQPKIDDFEKVIILIIGFLLVGFLSIAIFRTTNRFNITLDIVHSLEENDVSPIIHRENKERHDSWFNRQFRKNSIHGKWVPGLMLLTFVAGIIYHIVKFVLQRLEIIAK
jgi:hypothetical protein